MSYPSSPLFTTVNVIFLLSLDHVLSARLPIRSSANPALWLRYDPAAFLQSPWSAPAISPVQPRMSRSGIERRSGVEILLKRLHRRPEPLDSIGRARLDSGLCHWADTVFTIGTPSSFTQSPRLPCRKSLWLGGSVPPVCRITRPSRRKGEQ